MEYYTLKDLAYRYGRKDSEAIRQCAEKHKNDELRGHIVKKGRKNLYDEAAVAFLDTIYEVKQEGKAPEESETTIIPVDEEVLRLREENKAILLQLTQVQVALAQAQAAHLQTQEQWLQDKARIETLVQEKLQLEGKIKLLETAKQPQMKLEDMPLPQTDPDLQPSSETEGESVKSFSGEEIASSTEKEAGDDGSISASDVVVPQKKPFRERLKLAWQQLIG